MDSGSVANRNREGLQLAKRFLEYCFSISDMMTLDEPTEIIKLLKEYALKSCDGCGGAMCDSMCPISKYVEDMDKWLKGEKTAFFPECFDNVQYPSLPALPLLGRYPEHYHKEFSKCADCVARCCWAGQDKIAAKCNGFEDKNNRDMI